MYFKSKGIEYAIHKTIGEYAALYPQLNSMLTSSSSTPASTKSELKKSIERSFSRLGILNKIRLSVNALDPVKVAEYNKSSATCKLKMARALSDINREFVRQHPTAKDRWNILKAKYQTTTPQENRKDLKRITSF